MCPVIIVLQTLENVALNLQRRWLTTEWARPLTDLGLIFHGLEQAFEEQWADIEKRGKKRARPETDALVADAKTVDDLMKLGPDTLKEVLEALGLKSGGTLHQRAERLLLANNTPIDKLVKGYTSARFVGITHRMTTSHSRSTLQSQGTRMGCVA